SAISRVCVSASNRSISRVYPATSAIRMAASLRRNDPCSDGKATPDPEALGGKRVTRLVAFQPTIVNRNPALAEPAASARSGPRARHRFYCGRRVSISRRELTRTGFHPVPTFIPRRTRVRIGALNEPALAGGSTYVVWRR